MSDAVWAVVPAGGTGARFSPDSRYDKLLTPLGGVPVLMRTVQALMAARLVSGVVVAVNPDKIDAYRQALAMQPLEKPLLWTTGGATRRESVMRGLEALPDSVGVVVIHDAARPLVMPDLVDAAIAALLAGDVSGVVVALPVRDTLKRVDAVGCIVETVDRQALWQAQTPQVIWRDKLVLAHRAVPLDAPVTDDVQLLELAGLGPVQVVQGNAGNLKITLPGDLALAENILANVIGAGQNPSLI